LAVKAALRQRDVNGIPVWMISPYMRRFLYEIKRWHWNKENRPIDKDDHIMETFYRMVLDNPQYVSNKQANFIDPMDTPITGLESDERTWGVNKYDL
jgi:hypothetical protein